MKYIRTKDAIYKVRKPALDEYLWEDSTYVYGHEHIDNKDIIKRADTIEELCDELVIANCWFDSKPFVFPKHKSVNPLEEIWTHYDNETVCYGAIWTDKGLIYVAKMNEKGELKLL